MPASFFKKGRGRKIDPNHYNLKNKTNTLRESGTLSTTVEMGAKNQGNITFLAIFFHCGKNT